MNTKKAYLIAAAIIIQAGLLWNPVQGQDLKIQFISNFDHQDSYRPSGEDGLFRGGPDHENLRYYRSRMIKEGWTEADFREDLRRIRDNRGGGRMSRREAEQIVRDAYREVLGRNPDWASRVYVDKILYEGWTEEDLIRELRNSDEYKQQGSMSREEAERIVRRAYREVLRRNPDWASRAYIDKILYEGWTEEDLIRELRNSDEYRRRGSMSREEAERIVRRAYRSELNREPDPASRGWVDRILRDHWTEQDLVRALRDSDEYRKKHR